MRIDKSRSLEHSLSDALRRRRRPRAHTHSKREILIRCPAGREGWRGRREERMKKKKTPKTSKIDTKHFELRSSCLDASPELLKREKEIISSSYIYEGEEEPLLYSTAIRFLFPEKNYVVVYNLSDYDKIRNT